MKLYGFPPSPNTWKVRAVAAHLGIKLDFVLVDLTKPRTPEYLAIHPAGRTPALVDGDFKPDGIQRHHAVPREPEARTRCGRTTPRRAR